MNHIPWHKDSPITAPVVPYLCAKEETCQGLGDFERKFTLHPPYLKPSCSDLEFAAKSQAWLYFGLLSVFLMADLSADDLHTEESNIHEPGIDETALVDPNFDDADLDEATFDDSNRGESALDEPDVDEPGIDALGDHEPDIDDSSVDYSDINYHSGYYSIDGYSFDYSSIHDFSPDNFLITPREGQTLVDSSGLLYLLNKRISRYDLESQDPQAPTLTDHGAVLSIALTKTITAFAEFIIPRIKQMEKEDENLDPWSSAIYSIYFSIDILIDTLHHLLCRLSPILSESLQRRPMFTSETNGIARSLLLVGRCPSLISRLDLSSSNAYQLLSLPVSNMVNRHRECSRQVCSVFNIFKGTYETKHSENCNSPSCRFVRVDHQKLLDIIDSVRIPLVSSSIDSEGNISLEIIPAQDSGSPSYTAISHVWAGGLGNFTENALPECQLRHIHANVDNSGPDISLRDPKHTFRFLDAHAAQLYNALFRSSKRVYWLDTLCVPVQSADYRTKAIASMARIYAGASNVLVLDPELQQVTRKSLTTTQLDHVVACSPWMARSWTLQEGALAIDLRLAFKDTTVRLPTTTDYPLLRRSLIQKPWYEDIDHTVPEGPKGSLFGYAYQYIWSIFFAFAYRPDEKAWRPATQRRSPEYSYNRFVAAWNDLTGRSTTQSQDLAAILAALMNLSAGEVLNLPEDQRMKALLKKQSVLPIDILFASPAFTNLDWIPDFPSCDTSKLKLRETPLSGDIRVTDLGLLIEKCDYTVIVVQPDFPTFGRVLLHDLNSDFKALISFDLVESEQLHSSASPKLFLFSSNPHDSSGFSKGLCFRIESDASDGVLVTPYKSFAYKEDNPEAHSRQQTPWAHHTVYNVFHAYDVSAEHPLVIGLGRLPIHTQWIQRY